MIADAVIAATTLALAVIMTLGVTEMWIILLAVAVRSVGAGFQTPAVQAMITQITPADQLLRINGMFGTIQSAMSLLAPAVAAGVFALWGIVPTFFLDVATAVVGIAFLAFVRVPSLARMEAATTIPRAPADRPLLRRRGVDAGGSGDRLRRRHDARRHPHLDGAGRAQRPRTHPGGPRCAPLGGRPRRRSPSPLPARECRRQQPRQRVPVRRGCLTRARRRGAG
jgi:MFS family permease